MDTLQTLPQQQVALGTYIKLLRAAESVSSDVLKMIKASNLTASQFGVLEALFHLGPMCQKELAIKILKSTGNITLVVDNLEKRKLVTRKTHKKDRRFFTIALSPKGSELIAKLFPMHAQDITKRMDLLSTKEQIQLGELCKKLKNSVQP